MSGCSAGLESRWAAWSSWSSTFADGKRDRLNCPQTSVGQGVGEVFGFSPEVGDEGVQAQRVGGLGQHGLHDGGRLVGEVVPVFDGEAGGLDDGAQFLGSDQMAARGFVGPGQWIVEFAVVANRDVPHGKPSAVRQHPARLGVQARLVGDVHLDVLADGDVESAVGEGEFGHVRLTNGDEVAEADDSVEPTVRFAVFVGEIHGDNGGAVAVGDIARGATDPASGVEDPGAACDLRQVHQLGGGVAAHNVKVLQQAEVGGREAVEVLSGGEQRVLDVAARQTGRVLALDRVVHFCT